jgi:hypothetical protein
MGLNVTVDETWVDVTSRHQNFTDENPNRLSETFKAVNSVTVSSMYVQLYVLYRAKNCQLSINNRHLLLKI